MLQSKDTPPVSFADSPLSEGAKGLHKRYYMKLINIGFGNLVAANRLLAVVSPDSAPIKRVIQEARDRQMLIDASYGRKTASVLLMDTDHVILSAMTPEVIGQRSTEQLRKYEEDET